MRLNTYEEIRRSKGIFDEILEGMTHGASSAGVRQALPQAQARVCGTDEHAKLLTGSGASKSEWSILQVLEAANRHTKIAGIEISDNGGHRILSLMAHERLTRIWIMLDPKSPPFYKQLPANVNYDVSETELEKIRTEGNPISSAYAAIESHLTKQEAEQ